MLKQYDNLEELTDQISIPAPIKGKTREMTVRFAGLFAIKVADDFKKTQDDSNDLEDYIEFLDSILWIKYKQIQDKQIANDGNVTLAFDKDDKYELNGMKAQIVVNDSIEQLESISKFIKASIRLFWDAQGSETRDLGLFIGWFPDYINNLSTYEQPTEITNIKKPGEAIDGTVVESDGAITE